MVGLGVIGFAAGLAGRPNEDYLWLARLVASAGFPDPGSMNFSVIILNWNGREHLESCFTALAAQTLREFETIMVDNASQDDSINYVRERFPWVRLVALTENRGFSGGNAAGLAVALGENVVLLNNDTRPESDWMKMLSQCASVHPEIGMIASHLTDWNGENTDSAGDGCRVTGRGFARHRRLPVATAPDSGPVFGACAGAALYRRKLIEDVGFLDEDFFLNFEDTDLAFRAQLRGWTAWFCREAVVRHRVSATQGAWSKINVYYGARNHLWVCAKNLPGRFMLICSPLIVAEILALFVGSVMHRRGSAYSQGFVAGLRGLPRMWRKRGEIQQGRRRTPGALLRQLQYPRLTVRGLRRMFGLSE